MVKKMRAYDAYRTGLITPEKYQRMVKEHGDSARNMIIIVDDEWGA
ncbi:MAG TPA: hypothetical protein PK659_10810 [Methanothrix sp.]|nr:hypothetical protein [Methanothrix sp.]HOL44734.1 hypothetical protein [Methanothrix sp.]